MGRGFKPNPEPAEVTNLEIRRRASADLEAAANWYESRRPGFGLIFLDEADSLFARIEEIPRQFPVVFSRCPSGPDESISLPDVLSSDR